MKEKSEFGRGLVICLAKFLEHYSNDQTRKINNIEFYLRQSSGKQREMLSEHPSPGSDYGKKFRDELNYWIKKIVPIWGDVEHALSAEVMCWANAASDHLYDIECPPGDQWNPISKTIKELQDLGLDMGHGDGLMGRKQYDPEDIRKLYRLAKEVLIFIDNQLGLDADWGEY